jgi:pimeloyl-ACP methyl ester carboxylesterase
MIAIDLLAAALLVALLAFAWYALVRRWYRIDALPAALEFARTADGWELAVLHRAPAVRRFREPVLLAHGLSVSARNFDYEPPYSLAHYLADRGFECFSADWRGAGASRPARGEPHYGFSVDDHIRLDAPALLAHTCAAAGASRAFWVGHSMGALIGYAAAESEENRERLKGMVAVGAPVFFPFEGWMHRLVDLGALLSWPRALRQKWLSVGIAPWLGYLALPLADMVVNPKAITPRQQRKLYANLVGTISRGVLLQFRDWIHHDAFRSRDWKIDYREGLKQLDLPVLVLGGSADRLARPSAIEGQHALLGSTDKTLMIFGTENGDALDYGHGDLIFGEGAPREVFPRIAAWLEERATPL